MNTFDKICLGVMIALAVISLYFTFCFVLSYVREKEKAIIGSLESLIGMGIATAIFGVIFLFEREPFFVAAMAFELFAFPSSVFTVLTPKGICRVTSITPKYKPVSELSYEFRNNHLEIYTKGKKGFSKYQLGIKDIKTVKLLADWYPKHELTNPLAPEDNETKGEE